MTDGERVCTDPHCRAHSELVRLRMHKQIVSLAEQRHWPEDATELALTACDQGNFEVLDAILAGLDRL